MDIKYRFATIADAQMLFDWRNDLGTRAASIHPGSLGWAGHVRWLDNILTDHTRRLWIALSDQPMGVVRFDRLDTTRPELSWTVAPEHRGQGVGKAMLRSIVGDQPLMARIRQDNLGSRAVADAAGFVFVACEEGVETWEYDP